MSQRAMTYLNNKRIVYRRYSSDEPTASYNWGWYYAEGTYGYYSLFNTKAKINTKPVSYTHLRAHETKANLVCRLLLEKKKK